MPLSTLWADRLLGHALLGEALSIPQAWLVSLIRGYPGAPAGWAEPMDPGLNRRAVTFANAAQGRIAPASPIDLGVVAQDRGDFDHIAGFESPQASEPAWWCPLTHPIRIRQGDRLRIPSDAWSVSFTGGVSLTEANRLLNALFHGSPLQAAPATLAILTAAPQGDSYDELLMTGLHRSTLSLTRISPARLANLTPCAWGTPSAASTVTHLAALDPEDGRLRYFAPAQPTAIAPWRPLTATVGSVTLTLA